MLQSHTVQRVEQNVQPVTYFTGFEEGCKGYIHILKEHMVVEKPKRRHEMAQVPREQKVENWKMAGSGGAFRDPFVFSQPGISLSRFGAFWIGADDLAED